MLHRILCLTIVALFAASALGQQVDPKSKPESPSRFVMHEWGTFTSMQGADGTSLDGLQYEEEALPDFVHTYGGASVNKRSYGARSKLIRPLEHVTQKMETPVIYFYSDIARDLTLQVDFVQGLMTQWFPRVFSVGPKASKRGATPQKPLDVSKIKRSYLQWSVKIHAQGSERPSTVPATAPEHPWSLARNTDACWLSAAPVFGSPKAKKVESERYLFYRGLGSFNLPYVVKAEPKGKITLENQGEHAVRGVFALQVTDRGARFTPMANLRPRMSASVDLGVLDFRPLDIVIKELEAEVVHTLVQHGLYEKEALAMVATWSRSWFRTQGSRILYCLPTPETEALLPIKMNIKPDEVVRVLVGRLEFITPEVTNQIIAALDAGESPTMQSSILHRVDRFLEPHLREARRVAADSRIASRAVKLLQELAASAAPPSPTGAGG